jgi:hypothetical protein
MDVNRYKESLFLAKLHRKEQIYHLKFEVSAIKRSQLL